MEKHQVVVSMAKKKTNDASNAKKKVNHMNKEEVKRLWRYANEQLIESMKDDKCPTCGVDLDEFVSTLSMGANRMSCKNGHFLGIG